MSIKLFGKGLGIFDHPFDVGDRARIDPDQDKMSVIVDTTRPVPGALSTNSQIRDALQVRPQIRPPGDGLFMTIQQPTPDIRNNFDILYVPRPTTMVKITPQLYSQYSAPAPFETLFHDFDIQAFPYYNFWTPDELTNDKDEPGNRKFEDMPRFIKVFWTPAPNLPDPEERLAPRTADIRPISPTIFSKENIRPKVFIQKGVAFTPDHLQAIGFSKIKGIIGNGYLAPGVLETVVEMPLNNTGLETEKTFTQTDPINHIDEDTFLTHPDLQGVAIHELQGQVLQLTNGIANMATPTPPSTSPDLAAGQQAMVDGKFMISKSIRPGGFTQITSIQSSSPSISFMTRTAIPARKEVVDNVIELTQKIIQPENVSGIETSAQVKVKFVNPSIGGLIDYDKINLLAAPHQVETMVAIAPVLPHLEILSRSNMYNAKTHFNIPSLPSPKTKPLEYIGYILEKYKRQDSGAFVKVDEIDIPVREADSYVDTKILYGEVYRYRIKAVLRWNRPTNQQISGMDPLVEQKFGSHTAPSAGWKSSYLTTEWSHTWAYGSCIDDQPPGPPDELTVRPESAKKQIVITFKLPDNPQKDILLMRLYRKKQDADTGVDISGWEQITETDSVDRRIDFAPQNVIHIDKNVEFVQTSQEKNRIKYVYAAQCTSRHGEDSTLSEQIGAKLNSDYLVRGEYPVDFVSSPGVRLDYFGNFSVSPYRVTKTDLIVQPAPTKVGKSPGSGKLVLSGRDTMGNPTMDDGEYVCRVQSLDTGEAKDIPISVSFKNIQSRMVVADYNFFVSTHSILGKNSNEFKNDSEKMMIKELKSLQFDKAEDIENEDNDVLPTDRAIRGERY